MVINKTEVWGFEHAIRGARNPLESHAKSDSVGSDQIGSKDLELLQRLVKAGSDERKFMRQIFVSTDITAPLYWWKEFDTYKVGTVTNSTSTMHKLATTPITIDRFETSEFTKNDNYFLNFLNHLESLRKDYLSSKDKAIWKSLIEQLPESWLQIRTVTMNYENIRNMYFARRNHKLSEWHLFCEWIAELPYAKKLVMLEALQEGTVETSNRYI